MSLSSISSSGIYAFSLAYVFNCVHSITGLTASCMFPPVFIFCTNITDIFNKHNQTALFLYTDILCTYFVFIESFLNNLSRSVRKHCSRTVFCTYILKKKKYWKWKKVYIKKKENRYIFFKFILRKRKSVWKYFKKIILLFDK